MATLVWQIKPTQIYYDKSHYLLQQLIATTQTIPQGVQFFGVLL